MDNINVSKWHMHRLGLVDFWCYENDEMYFQDGHMLLRGSNGSGKSVTMQSFIPLLLDGNRSSERLDSFGTRSRKMDTYLIDENSERDERIGYLFLEFKREESELYKTIGMGLRARRNKPLEAWYFIIEDNRRINFDFSLMENHLTLSEKQLKNILGDQVFRGQTEYMRRVNEALFGFSNLDDYKDAIDLLIQVRSPKLSNSLSPSKINEILAKSLQPLSEDDLRPMSDAITSMDNLQDELENLNTSFMAAKKIAQAYDVYNKAILIDKWQKYTKENDEFQKIEKDINEKENILNQLKINYDATQNQLSQDNIRLEIVQKEKSILIDPNIERLHDEMLSLKKQSQELKQQIKTKENQCELKEDKIIDLKQDISNYENKIYENNKNYQKTFSLLDEIFESFPFSEHSALKETLKNEQEFDFEYTKKRLKEETKRTQDVINNFTIYETIITQIQKIEENMINVNHDLEINNQKLENSKQIYANCIEEYQEYFYRYNQNNQVLKLSENDLQKMSEYLSDYEYTKDYHCISEIVHQQYLSQFEDLTRQKGILNLDLLSLKKQYDNVNSEYQAWLDKKDFEPIRDGLTIKHRQSLTNNQIDYLPFYQLLDFDDNLSDQDKNKIEEMLMQMHIIDAIVVNVENKETIINNEDNGHDYYLWSTKPLESLSVIKVTLPFDEKQLNDIFNQLGIATTNDLLIQDSYFKSGALTGKIAQNQTACLIGFERRKLVRQQKLDDLLQELENCDTKIKALELESANFDELIIILKKEAALFKDEIKLKGYLDEIEKLQKETAYLEEKINQLLTQKSQENQRAKTIYQEIKDKCYNLLLNESKEAVLARQKDIEAYSDNLDNLKDALTQTNHYQKLLSIEIEKREELQNDVDNLNVEIINANDTLMTCIGKITSIQEELDKRGYRDKQKKLESLEIELTTLQNDIQRQIKELSKLETQQNYNQEGLQQALEKLQNQKIKRDIYNDLLIQEVEYGLVIKNQSEYLKELKQLVSQVKSNKTVSDYLSSLQSVFFEQVAYLSQYHLTHEMDELCHETDNVSKHFMIKATNQGKKVPFYNLLDILNERIESQKLLIVKEDRLIFEEILVNTIGKKIRYRIQASKRWVTKMDRYMHDMNTSSGLQLGVKWRAKKALDDEELDTQKLVELLEKDYRVLKDSDRQKISQHFRSKIETARRLSLDENTSASFHQLIKEVMDYREWFEFTLFAKKPNENRKELTNRIFYAYSGGEKAIAMYVPLFSAVAAKLESARDDAPHLIALDEAFAGVDENNIDNLFALITKFNFDYIMTSQALWGDYATCKSLAIYELFRPNNAPYITKVAYVWNGHVRKVVTS